MVAINRVARAVVLLALVWSLGSLLAAVNWHGNFLALQRSGDSGSEFVLHAQERWQHWVDMTLVGVVVAVLALVCALWPLVRAAGQRARAITEVDLRGHDGFGGGSEEVRRHSGERDAV